MTEDPIAAMDQMIRGMQDVSKALYAFYRENVEAGFTETQALDLCRTWLATLLQNQKDES